VRLGWDDAAGRFNAGKGAALGAAAVKIIR
jgi:hypothetical protein